jgi:hypothetical protein
VGAQDPVTEELDAIDCDLVQACTEIVEIGRLGCAKPNVDVLAQACGAYG